MKMRLIDADKLMEFAKNHANGSVDCNDIARFSLVDAVPVRHGRWTVDGECSLCGKFDDKDPFGSAYCPNCGARMDGGDQDADD